MIRCGRWHDLSTRAGRTGSIGAGWKRTRSPPPCTAFPGTTTWSRTRAEEGRQAWRAEVGQLIREADAIAAGELTQADAITLDCTREAATQEQEMVDLAAEEHTVTAMHY